MNAGPVAVLRVQSGDESPTGAKAEVLTNKPEKVELAEREIGREFSAPTLRDPKRSDITAVCQSHNKLQGCTHHYAYEKEQVWSSS